MATRTVRRKKGTWEEEMNVFDNEQRMADSDWHNKTYHPHIRHDSNHVYEFMESVLQERDYRNVEDEMIAMLDNEEEEADYSEHRKALVLKANRVKRMLSDDELVILQAYVKSRGYENMALILGCSLSTAWKRWQKVQARINLLVKEL